MRACMVAYTYYELDNRVKRYAETLSRKGHHVDVISLRRSGQPAYETLNGVEVFRIQNRVIDEKKSITYLYKLLLFLFNSGVFLTKKHLTHTYDIIHVHSIPDFEVFAALVPKLLGAKIILDIHDIVPELYVSKFKVDNTSLIFKLLVLVEKASGAFADHVIVANHIWHRTLLSRSLTEDKCSVIMNYPNSRLFMTKPAPRDDGKVRLLYPGTLSWHQGLDIAIKATAMVKQQVGGIELHIYGDGIEKANLCSLIDELGLEQNVFLHDSVPSEQLATIMSEVDIGIEPKRNGSFSGDAFSTKILEFMAVGIPVVASNTRVHCYYFNDEVIKFFESDDVEDLASSILLLIRDEQLRRKYVQNAKKFVADFNWSKKENMYIDLVQALTGSKNAQS